jgi:hypothetical protein
MMTKNELALKFTALVICAMAFTIANGMACQSDPSNCGVTLKGTEVTLTDKKPGGGKCNLVIDEDPTEGGYLQCI